MGFGGPGLAGRRWMMNDGGSRHHFHDDDEREQ